MPKKNVMKGFDPAEAGMTQEEFEALEPYLSDTEFDESMHDAGPNKETTNIVVVDGLPKAPESKYSKLIMFVTKVVAQLGQVEENGIFMPVNDETKMTEGFALVEFTSVSAAENAVKSLNGFKLDAKHTLIANRYEDLDKHCDVPDKFEAPPLPEYKRIDDLWSWLGDNRLRDQFAIRYDADTEVHWAETNAAPAAQYTGERQREAGRNWCEREIKWSPQGTYFATFHPQGVLLWGGDDFREVARFAHFEVNNVLFSPCERYIATWNGCSNNPNPQEALIVWDLRSGAKLRAFKQVRNSDEPEFEWSPDGNFIGRLNIDRATGKELIQIYETPHMTLLGKRSIVSPGAKELQFAPGGKHQLFATSTPEGQNQPASVTLIRVPSKEVLRSKQLFNVEDIKMHWHPNGKYLAVQATLLSKAQAKKKKKQQEMGIEGSVLAGEKKGPLTTTFELFRVGERNVPVETMKVQGAVHYFAWEPQGSRFSIIHGEGPLRFDVSIYDMEPKEGSEKSKGRPIAGPITRTELVRTLEDRPVNHLSWSPRGSLIVLGGLENIGGELEFYDVDSNTTFNKGEHMQCNSVQWDPSGRLVATAKTQPLDIRREPRTRETIENGYVIWNFVGKRVYEENKTAMFQFEWRPRPALLNEDEARKVQKNIKKFIQRYQDEDRALEARRDLLQRLRHRRLRDNFRNLLAKRHQEYLDQRPQRVALGAENEDPDEGYEIQVYTYDQIVSRDVETLK